MDEKKINSELILNVEPSAVTIALIEDDKLVELHKESRESSFAVGNIYLGRVKKIMPGLNAAFVDIGCEKDAFVHYLDLGSQFGTFDIFLKKAISERKKTPVVQKKDYVEDLEKNGNVSEILKLGQEILVQITKEPISTKGARLTAEISIAGRNIVLIPFSDKVSVSQKIKSNEERVRLRQLIQSIKPKGFGAIIRTVATDKKVAELDSELKILVQRWEEVVNKVQKAKDVSLILEETSRTVSILRDIFNPNFENIHINDKEVFNEIRDYVSLIAPEKKNIVKYYDGVLPIFDNFRLTKQIKSSFGRMVSFKRSAYLIIEHTEAMHVIDVNSGIRAKADQAQEENALEVNLTAADEITRQLRLRDMGGIIAVDFIDLHESANRQQVYDRMWENMSTDRARHNILPLNKFGVMHITRQRVRPVMKVNIEETCPTCAGKGRTTPSILFTDELENKIDYLVNSQKIKKFTLFVHPYVYAFLNKGFFPLKNKWKFRYSLQCKVVPNQNLGFLEYKFLDKKKEEIELEE